MISTNFYTEKDGIVFGIDSQIEKESKNTYEE